MVKNVQVFVKSTKKSDLDDKIELTTIGKFYSEDEVYFVEYKENETSGMEGTTTIIEIYNNRVILNRRGPMNTKMEFEKAKKNITKYQTPYGILDMHIQTKELCINIDNDGGNISIDYNLAIIGDKLQRTKLEITIAPTLNLV
jgi:uncharacterized beta-barrel protein YwiB (DUF1934 family)